ncbi:adenosylcobalamin-dependent ribonucleoside-diphosphate reductase [Patescibacteria group bacterium]|nr:adenosylcobalamin-dependent ribonucleoside-diphosphate reductase [Patescibacteria group bacterium]
MKLKYFREPNLEPNAKKTLVSRCSCTNKKGDPVETPGEIFYRVARHLAKPEINWGSEKEVDEVSREFFEAMVDLRIVVTRSALFEAGNSQAPNQLSPCFVLPVDDSIASIFGSLGNAALIQKNFGGTGFNFSNLRPRGDKVRDVPGAASGPVEFLRVYSAALSRVIQGVKRHGGNMGILDVDHPDVSEFIRVKDKDETIKNFNISVGIKDKFMVAVKQDKYWQLINPRNNQVAKKVKARSLFGEICEHAWLSGDPGMIYLDRLEKDHYTPSLGEINATNPCGEQPLLPYESCNLSSVNLLAHLVKHKGSYKVDWNKLSKTIYTITRLLDNMIEVNSYLLPETEKLVKYGNRKIGAGVIGFAHVLYRLGIPYNSIEAVEMAKRMAKYFKQGLEKASLQLGRERGAFPNIDISSYKGADKQYRNCTMFTIAPTGTVSMIANTTPGIEPVFALAYERRTFFEKERENKPGEVLVYVDPILESVLKEKKLYTRRIIEQIIENDGELYSIANIPQAMKDVFVTTHRISWKWHVEIQAAWQSYVDNSVSKTINLPHEATVDDVKNAFMMAWKKGCKGCTVYRDGSKNFQVIATSKTREMGK